MESTERELRSLISQYTADPTLNINPFSMRLQGTIDANVQGGITKYEQAFLAPEFGRSATPREAAASARLRRLVASQCAVVDAGLALHARLAPDDVKPLHRYRPPTYAHTPIRPSSCHDMMFFSSHWYTFEQ